MRTHGQSRKITSISNRFRGPAALPCTVLLYILCLICPQDSIRDNLKIIICISLSIRSNLQCLNCWSFNQFLISGLSVLHSSRLSLIPCSLSAVSSALRHKSLSIRTKIPKDSTRRSYLEMMVSWIFSTEWIISVGFLTYSLEGTFQCSGCSRCRGSCRCCWQCRRPAACRCWPRGRSCTPGSSRSRRGTRDTAWVI